MRVRGRLIKGRDIYMYWKRAENFQEFWHCLFSFLLWFFLVIMAIVNGHRAGGDII
jgi:hypothetical protein